jgi:VanZ family protein
MRKCPKRYNTKDFYNMTLRKILPWIAVLLWMMLIYYLSSQVAEQSAKLSTGPSELAEKIIEIVAPEADYDINAISNIVRKTAHFFAYLVLGVLVTNSLRRSGLHGYRSLIFALLICVIYAVSDEVHQIFVPGRGPGVLDVLIDSIGATLGIGAYLLVDKIVKKAKSAV